MAPAPAAAGEAAVFAAPTAGVPASQRWLQQGVLAADHVAAGAFDSAMRLLNRRALAALASAQQQVHAGVVMLRGVSQCLAWLLVGPSLLCQQQWRPP